MSAGVDILVWTAAVGLVGGAAGHIGWQVRGPGETGLGPTGQDRVAYSLQLRELLGGHGVPDREAQRVHPGAFSDLGGSNPAILSYAREHTSKNDDGEQETWTLVRPEEANTLDGTISTESPVGSALVGRRVGDSAVVTTPGGQIVYTVISIA